MSTPFYKTARRHLSRNCPVLNQLIARVGPCTLTPNPADPFTLLVRCVISQQISTKAAASIFARLAELVGGPPVPMAKVSKLTDEKLQACGISGPKQRALRAVIDHVKENPKLLPGIEERDNDTIHEQLTAIKGIGPWSAGHVPNFRPGPDGRAAGWGLRVPRRGEATVRVEKRSEREATHQDRRAVAAVSQRRDVVPVAKLEPKYQEE